MAINIEERGLINAISTSPDNSQPRLDYAKWLDGNGKHEKAQLIRIALKLADIKKEVGHTASSQAHPLSNQKDALERRIDTLMGQHKQQWTIDLELPNGVTIPTNERWETGFPNTVEFDSVETFKRHAAEIAAKIPDMQALIRDDNLHANFPSMLDHLPDNVRKLAIYEANDGVVTELAEHPKSAQITNLNLLGTTDRTAAGPGNAITDDSIKALAESQYARNIRHLTIVRNKITDKGANIIRSSANFSQMEDLYIRDNLIGSGGTANLAGLEHHGGAISETLPVYNHTIRTLNVDELPANPHDVLINNPDLMPNLSYLHDTNFRVLPGQARAEKELAGSKKNHPRTSSASHTRVTTFIGDDLKGR